VTGGLAKELVVPEPNRSFQELAGCHGKCWIPEEIMKAWGDPPSAESMKENGVRICGFVGVVFVKELSTRSRWVHEELELLPQRFYLHIAQEAHSRGVPPLPVALELLLRELVGFPVAEAAGILEKVTGQFVD
jgi:hypothetical protein